MGKPVPIELLPDSLIDKTPRPSQSEMKRLQRDPSYAPEFKQRFGYLPAPYDTMKVPTPRPFPGLTTKQLDQKYQEMKDRGQLQLNEKNLADAYVDQQTAEAGPLGRIPLAIGTTAQQLAQGVPFLGGLVDEGVAGVLAATGGDYNKSLEYMRARDRQAHENAPYVSGGLNLLGGVATAYAAGPAALGINTTGQAAVRTLPSRVVTGGILGSGVGAADAFTRGEGGAENRLDAAKYGAGVGAVGGAAIPAVAQGATSATQTIADMLTSNQHLRRLGLSPGAGRILLRQMGIDDALLNGTGEQRILAGGPDAMVADSGPGATTLLDTSLQRSGPGSRQARNAIEQRATNAEARFTAEADRSFGQPMGSETRKAGVRQDTAQAREQTYGAAYARPIDYSSPLGRRLEGLIPRLDAGALRYANSLMQKEGVQSQQIRFTINPDNTVTLERMPDVRQWDYITQALNEGAYANQTSGAMGGFTRAARLDRNIAAEARNTLRQLVPEYGTALDTAADAIGRTQAIDLGRRLFEKGTTREELHDMTRNATRAELEALRGGVRDHIDEITANVSRMASDPNIDARELKAAMDKLTSRASGEKIAAILGPAAARRFVAQVNESMRALEMRASVSRNSATFQRLDTDRQVKAQNEPGVWGSLMQGHPLQAAQKGIQRLSGYTPDRQIVLDDQVYGEIANALTNARGPAAVQYIRQLQRAMAARNANQQTGHAVGTGAAGVLLGSTPQATNPVQDWFRR